METSEKTTYYYASVLVRFLAMLIDGALVAIVSGIVFSAFTDGNFTTLLTAILAIAYHTYCLSQRGGQTLGKQLMKIKVVTEAGATPSVETALIRTLATYLSGGVILLGYIWAFFNPRKQTWHDLIAKTVVVEA